MQGLRDDPHVYPIRSELTQYYKDPHNYAHINPKLY